MRWTPPYDLVGINVPTDRRFRSEIKLARKVSHRNVCRIREYGEDGLTSQ